MSAGNDEERLLEELRTAWRDLRTPVPPPEAEIEGESQAGFAAEGLDRTEARMRAWWGRAWAELPVPACPDPNGEIVAVRDRHSSRRAMRAWPSLVAALLLGILGVALWRRGGPGVRLQPTSAANPRPRICAVADDRVEFCSGQVRLVLLTDPTPNKARFTEDMTR